MYFPQVLDWVDIDTILGCDLLERWPTLQQLQHAHPGTLRKFFREHNCRSESLITERIAAIYQATPAVKDAALLEGESAIAASCVAQIRTLLASIAKLDHQIAPMTSNHPEASLFAVGGCMFAGPAPPSCGRRFTSLPRVRSPARNGPASSTTRRLPPASPTTRPSGRWHTNGFACCSVVGRTAAPTTNGPTYRHWPNATRRLTGLRDHPQSWCGKPSAALRSCPQKILDGITQMTCCSQEVFQHRARAVSETRAALASAPSGDHSPMPLKPYFETDDVRPGRFERDRSAPLSFVIVS
jgi:hypothetical protein